MAFVCVDFLRFLTKYQDCPVAVEFECGGFCKKAIGILTCIAPGFIRLERGGCYPFVRITLFNGNNPPEEECAEEIIIKKHTIIAVERLPFNDKCPDEKGNGNDVGDDYSDDYGYDE